MKYLTKLFILLLPFGLFSQNVIWKIEKTESFFPDANIINFDKGIHCHYLTVPENWNEPSVKIIKLAVVILKRKNARSGAEPLLFIQGGPGAGTVESIMTWINHPLREQNDIVLLDVRGTGFSLPKFCPDLGKQFLEILSKNQDALQDTQQKVIAAMNCRQDLVSRNIDLNAYNSKSIAKDLNALKRALQYQSWNVYAVSYGTYIAQVYANDFPADIKALILDSPIPDISENYYDDSISKYMNSLEKVFNECENDPDCNKEYPELENTYYKVVKKIARNPITVKVNKIVLPEGTFTYNVEDFKICLQQALYSKQLIEVIPLLITQFDKENESVLSALVASFSGTLSLDYGAFYCVTCNEAFPYNSISKFNRDASSYPRLKGGLSFYESDYTVCAMWNSKIDRSFSGSDDLSKLGRIEAPVLVLSGAFDPVTPISYGEKTQKKFKNSFLITSAVSGHAPGFSATGFEIIKDFIENPEQWPSSKSMDAVSRVDYIKNISINKGVSSFANSLNEFNLLFFAPFLIAGLILIISILSFGFTVFKKGNLHYKILKILLVANSIIGLYVIIGLAFAAFDTAQINFYILAFGLPDRYDYLYIMQGLFIGLTLIAVIYFLLKLQVFTNKSIIVAILFSFVVIVVYYQYWGFI